MRLLHVMNRELHENRKNLLIYSLAIFLVLFFQEMVGAITVRFSGGLDSTASYEFNFPLFLFLGGFILTSVSFSQDMFSRNGQHNWLMLPASSMEKFLAKALLTAFAYPLALTALFALSSIIIEALTLLFFGNPFSLFNPFTRQIGRMLLHYLVIQSIFLLGATYFRKTHFVKTILALGSIVIVLSLIGGLFVRIAFAPYLKDWLAPTFQMQITWDTIESLPAFRTFAVIGKILYWAVLPVFCWITAYLRVKEVQATDAIQ